VKIYTKEIDKDLNIMVTIKPGVSAGQGVTVEIGVSGEGISEQPPSGGSQTYPELIVSDVPQAYWRFEETVGTTAADEMGAHPGTYENVTMTETGFVKDSVDAVRFTGAANSHVIIPTHVLPSTGATGACSFEYWTKSTTTTMQLLWDKRGNTGGAESINRLFLSTNRDHLGANVAGKLCVFTRAAGASANVSTVSAIATLNDGNRHHLVFGLDGLGGTFIYFDGVSQAVTGLSETGQLHAASVTGRNGHLISGVDAGTFTADAAIDEFAVYRRLLSAAEVLEHYNAGIAA
jgi:hypothetical protein